MKTRTLITISILFLLIVYMPASGQAPSFSGEWKLNRAKSVFDPNQLYLSGIKIQLTADSLLTIRTYNSPDGQEYPFSENLSLDGKECKIVIYDMPRTSKANISAEKDSINLTSVTVFYGNSGEQNFNTSETWKLENDGNVLFISFTNSIAGNTINGKHYFDRGK